MCYSEVFCHSVQLSDCKQVVIIINSFLTCWWKCCHVHCHPQIELHHTFRPNCTIEHCLDKHDPEHAKDHQSISVGAVSNLSLYFSAAQWQDGKVFSDYLTVGSGSVHPKRDSGMKADLVTVYGFNRKWRSQQGRSFVVVG